MDNSHDVVNKPAHYTDGKIEVIDFIEDKKLGFHLGNAVKYISRAGKKDPAKTVEDLQKAKWYLEREINRLGGTELPEDDGETIIDKVAIAKTYDFLKQLGTLDMDSEEHRKMIGEKAASMGVKFFQTIREPYHRTYNILEVMWGDGSETRQVLRSPEK